MTPGSTALLEVLKFAENDFSFHWTKEGSRCQIQSATQPNVLTFNRVCEGDYGYYRCEVKEAGRVVLTVYRALFEEQCSTSSAEHPKPTSTTDNIEFHLPSKQATFASKCNY